MTEITTDVQPADKPKRTRAKKERAPHPAQALIDALEFVGVAQKKAGAAQQQFSRMAYKWLCVTNDVLTIGTPIAEELEICPHTLTLLDALKKCSGKIVMSQISDTAFMVKSGDFEALIPCGDPAEIVIAAPDDKIAPCDDRLKAALGGCAALVTEGALHVHLAAVLLQGFSCVATNGHCMLQLAHGIDLPPGMVMPKVAAVAIAKAKKPLSGFGYSANSATFWFEDGSFIKTQLFAEHYPNYGHILDVPNDCSPVPAEFFKAVKVCAAFDSSNVLTIYDNMVQVGDGDALVTYKLKTIEAVVKLNLRDLLTVEPFFKRADFKTNPDMVYFQADGARGCMTTFPKTPAPLAPVLDHDKIPF